MIGMTGQASPLGKNGTIGFGDGTNTTSSATLIFTGTSDSSDKLFALNLGSSAGFTLINRSGTLALTNSGAWDNGVSAGVKRVTLSGSGVGTLASRLGNSTSGTGGALSLVKSGTGQWTLTGSQSYTGSTQLDAGTLIFSKTSSLYSGNSANWTKANITTFSGSSATLGLGVGGTDDFTDSQVTTLLSNLGGDSSTGGMRATSSWGFDTTNASSPVTISGSIGDTSGGTGLTLGGRIGVAKLGSGTLTLSSGSNTYTFGTRVDGGELIAGSAGALGSGTGFLNINGGSLNLNGLTFNRGGGIQATAGQLRNGVISGTGSLIKTGTGVFRVAADANANTFSGSAAIQAGVVEVTSVSGTGSAQSLGTGSTAIALGSGNDTGTYRYIGSASGTTNRIFTLAGSTGGGVIEASGASGLLNITGTVTAASGIKTLSLGGTNTGENRIGLISNGNGTVSVDKVGAGTWWLAGANSFTGSFTLSQGTIVVDAAGALGSSERIVGSLAANSSGTAALFLANGRSVTTVDVATLGAGGSQSVFLGNTAGTGTFGGSSKLGRAVNLVAGGTMRFENTWTGTAGGSSVPDVNVTFGNSASLGKVLLANNLTTSGSVRINNGVLSVVNGNVLTGSAGPVIVAAGAELGGAGRVAGTVAGGGWIAPGDSPGILTVTALDPANGSTGFQFEFTGTGSPDYGSPTASKNDVLRIQDLTTPFISSLTASNTVNIYFNVGSLSAGNVFRGGFYTDRQSDFWSSVSGGNFKFYVKDNSGTAASYNGQSYSLFSSLYPSLTVSNTTVFEASSFSGTSGWVSQFSINSSTGPTSYTLSAAASNTTIFVGGTSTISGTVTNTGTGSVDSLAVSGFGITVSPSGSVSGFSPTSGTANINGGIVAGSGLFTGTAAGTFGFTPTATGSNATIGGLATLTTTSTASVTVLAHTSPTLSIITGGGQTVFVGGSFSPISYSLSNPGSNVSGLEVQSLNNLSGASGINAVAAGATGTYSATAPSTGSPTSGNQVVSLQAGDNSTINGANPLTTLSGTFAYTVLAHTSPTLSVITGGVQTIITGGTFAPISFGLSNPGSNVSALDVQSLSNLSGATGGAVLAAGATGTYSATAPSNVTVTSGNQLVSLQAGDDSTINGANPLTTLGGTMAYTVLDHSVGSLSGASTALTGTISLGTWDWQLNSWVGGSGSNSYALYNLATTSPSLTAALDVSGTSQGGDAGFSTNFNLGSYSLIGGGSSSSFLAMYDPTASGTVSGTYTATFTFVTRDQTNLSGATSGNTLILTAQVVVVPEPATIALAGLGAGLAGLLAYRRRKSQKRAA